MSFIIESPESKQYLLEDNAIEGFKIAVNNGQTRLALQILVSIIDVFGEIIASAVEADEDEDEEVSSVAEAPVEVKEVVAEPVVVPEAVVEEPKKEEVKKPATKKTSAKEETTTTTNIE